MWYDLLKIKKVYLQGRKLKVGNGSNTSLWKDSWLTEEPLMDLFPELFKLCDTPDISVRDAKLAPESITFSRWLVDELQNDWMKNQAQPC